MSENLITAAVGAQRVKKSEGVAPRFFTDEVASEYYLEIVLGADFRRSITCSNANIEDLVIGHLFTEGYISAPGDVAELKLSPGRAQVELKDGLPVPAQAPVEILTTGNCGAAQPDMPDPSERRSRPVKLDLNSVMEASEALLSGNPYFNSTGALHSAALCIDGGALSYIRVDLGRHNAADKSIGAALRAGSDLSKAVLFTTGRVPTDMIRKVIRSGVPAMISRGAVTLQAIELAKRYGVCLGGFSRGERINLYTPYYEENEAQL